MSLTAGTVQQNGAVGIVSCVEARPTFHTPDRGPDWFDKLGVPYYYVPFPDPQRPDRRRFDALRALKALHETTQTFRPDVLHLHSFSLFPYLWVTRQRTKIPIVSTIHLDVDPDRMGTKILGGINLVAPFLPDRMIALCREQEEAFRTILHASEDRIARIPHGIDDTHFRPPRPAERSAARANLGLLPGVPTVCLIGRLDHVKGHDVLIRALSRLQVHGLPVTALFAGTGAGEESIRHHVEAAGLSNHVRFLGFSDPREVLWASDVNVLPSRREAFPLVILESMLCGTVPIRTPASGACDQIIDGSTGFIIPFDDDATLSKRLSLLLTNPSRRTKMAEAALARARSRFTSQKMIDRTFSLYAEMTGIPPISAPSVPDGLAPSPARVNLP
jgi:glycosyltransferase involved in cell wall biosynthesis